MYDISATGLNGLTIQFEGTHFDCSSHHVLYVSQYPFLKDILYN